MLSRASLLMGVSRPDFSLLASTGSCVGRATNDVSRVVPAQSFAQSRGRLRDRGKRHCGSRLHEYLPAINELGGD